VLFFLKSITKATIVSLILAVFFSFSTLWYFSTDLPDYK
ncbi:uncharacterized protein METZ01_LOCUS431989, partial [marine metagenome]